MAFLTTVHTLVLYQIPIYFIIFYFLPLRITGGRQLDGVLSAVTVFSFIAYFFFLIKPILLQIDALPGIVAQVNGRCEVFLDGGVTQVKIYRIDSLNFLTFKKFHRIFLFREQIF